MLLCRNQLEATQPARKRGESHPSGARGVRRLNLLTAVVNGFAALVSVFQELLVRKLLLPKPCWLLQVENHIVDSYIIAGF